MAEESSGYTTGHVRRKYLDLANMYYAQGSYPIAERFVNDFIGTIPEDKPAAKKIRDEFNKIAAKKRKEIGELERYVESLGYLEKKDVMTDGRSNIEINAIHDKMVASWIIAEKESLFND